MASNNNNAALPAVAAGLAGAVVLALAFRPGPAPVWRYAPTVDGECGNGLPPRPPPSDLPV